VFCALVDVLAVAENDTVPFPDPLAPLVMLNQLAVSLAVQAQPLGAVTVAEPVPPTLGIETLDGDTVNVQVGVPPVNENVSTDSALLLRPPGPTAATLAL
jgi:hypothetical protein